MVRGGFPVGSDVRGRTPDADSLPKIMGKIEWGAQAQRDMPLRGQGLEVWGVAEL